MDFSGIGAWAGEHGPYLAIIGGQWVIIRLFMNRMFAQQDIVIKALSLSTRLTEVAEKTLEPKE